MKNENYIEVKVDNNIRIYSLNYLMDGELTESDLEWLLTNKCLNYSLIVNMFKFSEHKMTIPSIIKMIRKDNTWTKNYTWTHKQLEEFEEILSKIYYNVYRYKGEELKSYVQWFTINYALQVNSKNTYRH